MTRAREPIPAELITRLPARSDPTAWTAQETVAFIELMLLNHDMDGVEHALTLLVGKDAHLAGEVRDMLLLGVAINRTGAENTPSPPAREEGRPDA